MGELPKDLGDFEERLLKGKDDINQLTFTEMVIQEPLELSGVHLILRTQPNWDQWTKRSDGAAEGGRGEERKTEIVDGETKDTS